MDDIIPAFAKKRSPHVPVDRVSLAQPTKVPTAPLNQKAYATPTSSNLCIDGKKAVLLQAARASIYNPARPRSIEV